MLDWFFEILAPSTFTKGIYKYNKGEYQSASRLLKRAAKWMPELNDDGLLYAYQFLVNYHLGKKVASEDVKLAVEKLSNSSYKDQSSYVKIEIELKKLYTSLGH